MNEGRLEIWVDEAIAADIEMVAWGGYHPLHQLMDGKTYQAVVKDMRLLRGDVFPLPIVLPVAKDVAQSIGRRDVIHVRSLTGLIASLWVTDIFTRDLEEEALRVYGTQDRRHPGVAKLFEQSATCVAGPVDLIRERASLYAEPHRPADVKARIAATTWQTIAAFQTRNPVHRAHEYLHKVALDLCDGLLLHPLVGPTKEEDVPSDIRMQSYRIALTHYYPQNRVILATFGAAMRYAGPREALFHAITRKNYGATHYIVGRDAAGVGGFYEPDAARKLIAAHADTVGIVPIVMPKVGYCPVCEEITTEKRCPHATRWQSLSGTEVRARLRDGQTLPKEFTRPEISQFLVESMKNFYPGKD